MAFVYILVVYNIFHQQQAILPGSYPDLNACKAAQVQIHLTIGNWSECTPLGVKAPLQGRLK